jgi:hypothetical protein
MNALDDNLLVSNERERALEIGATMDPQLLLKPELLWPESVVERDLLLSKVSLLFLLLLDAKEERSKEEELSPRLQPSLTKSSLIWFIVSHLPCATLAVNTFGLTNLWNSAISVQDE